MQITDFTFNPARSSMGLDAHDSDLVHMSGQVIHFKTDSTRAEDLILTLTPASPHFTSTCSL